MVRKQNPHKRTLAVGDGANDCAMLLGADVGVGICGRVDSAAAQVSDFTVGSFRNLKPLLFVHGRENYRKNSDFVIFHFYSNFLFIGSMFWFGCFSKFSG
jgi:phospholipid-transporting ATPase